jgi:hypothetical protein
MHEAVNESECMCVHIQTYKQVYSYPVKTGIHLSLQFLYSLYCMLACARMYYEYDQINFKI